MTQPPERISLSTEEAEALMARVHQSGLRAEDAGVVEQVIRMYVWVVCALQEAKLSLKRLRSWLCGKGAKPRQPPVSTESSASSQPVGDGEEAKESLRSPEGAPGVVEAGAESGPEASQTAASPKPTGGHRPGTGRLGADASEGAARVECRHEE